MASSRALFAFWGLFVLLVTGAAQTGAAIAEVLSNAGSEKGAVYGSCAVAAAAALSLPLAFATIADGFALAILAAGGLTLGAAFALPLCLDTPFFPALPWGLALLQLSALGLAAGSGARSLGRLSFQLGALQAATSPFRLLGFASLLAATAALGTALGTLRYATLVAAGLALLSWFALVLGRGIHGRSCGAEVAPAAGSAVLVASAIAGISAEHLVPFADVRAYPGTVIFTSEGRKHYVVTVGPFGLDLYADGTLRVSELDAHRYFEALVRPALLSVPSPRRVLVLEGGTGLTEHEIFRGRDAVKRVTVVATDPQLVKLARGIRFLRERSGGALDDPRIHWVFEEPVVWLERATGSYDLIVLDLPPPAGYLEGKNYTTHFLGRVSALLAPEGALVLPATSAFETPDAHASILQTLGAVGLTTTSYRVPLPALGEWSFALASKGPLPAPKGGSGAPRFLDPTTLAAVFRSPADASDLPAPPSTLHEQRATQAFGAVMDGPR